MRKAQKQDILKMIETLNEAHEQIKYHIEKNNYMCAQDMLVECQECAISIGNAIESFEGEGFATISFIEEYCDSIYHAHEDLANNTHINENRIYKNLRKQLIRIENSIKNDISVRKEIAFFPYKASMWDSLESIYLAAKADPDCDVYCVPIPYYDLKPDHSFGEMHYEGREYPKNIEVIDWQTYNFEERKPDIAYIHNPYDNWNLVTSVHPRFYSANLKKCVEELVYVPYFILQEIEPDNQAAIDSMKHFIWTPGVINADKVIVQSEKMAQIYVNEYQKAALANGLPTQHTDRALLEKKFLGLGSPKIDKVLNTKKEDLEIPKEWLEIIEKPDGTWKKIIFYNTSIAALLENNEKMLEKMKDVFRIFYENKDEVALLWRPHPLIENTVKSMRPQLWEKYKKLVDWYKKEGWGIYDDTADMDRAVVLSDAYYGDNSSVVQMYQKTGKPVMVQDCTNEGTEFNRSYLPFDGGVCHGNKIYCIHRNHKAIYSIDLNTLSIEYENRLVSEKGIRSYTGIYEYKNKIYFIPGKEEAVTAYDSKSEEYEIYSYGLSNYNVNKFYSAVGYNDKLYLFPIREKFVLKIDLNTKIIDKIVLPVQSEDTFLQFGYFTKRHIISENKLMIPCACTNLLLIMDMETEEMSWKKFSLSDCGFQDIEKYEGNIYLLDRNRNIYCIKVNEGDVEEKVCQLEEDYEFTVECGNEIAMIPKYVNQIAFWNPRTNQIRKVNYPFDYRFVETKMITFSDICCTKEKIYLIPRACNRLVWIDRKTKEVVFESWDIGEKTKQYLLREMIDKTADGEVLEEIIYSIKNLITLLEGD